MDKTIRKGDVVQFIEGHKWIGCLGIVNEVKDCGNGKRYMVGVPAPMQGTAYIFDDGSGIERIGRAALVAKEETRMTQRELIDFCTRRESSVCNSCPHDKECDAYLDKFHTIPFQEKELHPERYTNAEIVMEGSSDE